ncbi:hypothetical protein [Atlantibacter hermannii]|uniref:hypothetical protein n=1 Tax=Atlantibacter hermannii TaxID=565 RepID=UPI0028A64984|nr:hypothetical protein [Atlantibacter hermannii]
MRELNQNEIAMVNGAWSKSLADSIEGALYGFGTAMTTGIALGAINTKSNGLGFGVIAQGVGAVAGGVLGALVGGIGGFAFGKDGIGAIVDEYTARIGQ